MTLQQIRRNQVYRLERPPRRPLMGRLLRRLRLLASRPPGLSHRHG